MIRTLFLSVALVWTVLCAAQPVKVIFETDMGNDVDDVLALDMLYKYEEQGLVELLLISCNKADSCAVPFIRSMNAFYGRPEIPVATSPADRLPAQRHKSPGYAEQVVRSGRFPIPGGEVYDSVGKYREILAAQEDAGVVIVSVGFCSNLQRLLLSEPDRYSELPGRELVARKVKYLSMMGGNFADDTKGEFNIRFDIGAAREVFASWPTPVLLSPWELGGRIFFRGETLSKLAYAAEHPLKMAYESYLPMPYDRECWDQTSVLAALPGVECRFTLSERGRVEVDDRGVTRFVPTDEGRIRLLGASPRGCRRLAREIERTVTRVPRRFVE